MRDDGIEPVLPANPAPYLTDWLFEIGPVVPAGMSEGPLGYLELAAWQAISGVELMPWEARALRRLSDAYLAEKHRAAKVDCPAPYGGEEADIEVNRAQVSAALKAAFSGLKKKAARDKSGG